MNKNKLKKKIEFNFLDKVLNRSSCVSFFCIHGLTVNERILLKKKLNEFGFSYKLIKNTVLSKSLLKLMKVDSNLIHGSLAFSYSTTYKSLKDESLCTEFSKVVQILEKNENTFILANLFDKVMYNNLLSKKISGLKDFDTVYFEQLRLIQQNILKVLSVLSLPKNNLYYLLKKNTG